MTLAEKKGSFFSFLLLLFEFVAFEQGSDWIRELEKWLGKRFRNIKKTFLTPLKWAFTRTPAHACQNRGEEDIPRLNGIGWKGIES